MSEYKTLDEWFPNGRGDGRKFTNLSRFKDTWIEPVFKSNACFVYEARWHCLDENGGNNPIIRDSLQMKFKVWHPPKKKVTKYLWVDAANEKIRPHFYKDMSELLKHSVGSDYGSQIYIRLDWSATEFDDEN